MKWLEGFLATQIGVILFVFFFSLGLWAHQGHHQASAEQVSMAAPQGDQEREKFAQINQGYIKEVKPIFVRSCFDCHSSQTQYPWYYQIPGVRQFIDSDINEAREHLDFERDFPFKSHAMPVEDLKAIAEETVQNEMPPMSYRLLHSGSTLTEKEKEIVNNWVEKSLQTLIKKTNN